MEWWKAWTVAVLNNSIIQVYGKSDQYIIKNNSLKRTNYQDLKKQILNEINYSSINYGRKKFYVPQPPIYLYHLLLIGKLYYLFDSNVSNNRFFNFFINIIPLFYTFLIAYVLFKYTIRYSISLAKFAVLAYLLNPLILLNAPVQGYWDELIAAFTFLSLLAIYQKKYYKSFGFFIIAILSKPTSIIILPILFFVSIKELNYYGFLKVTIFSLLLLLLIFSPFLLNNHIISAMMSILSIKDELSDLSRSSLNLWWPVQYVFNMFKYCDKNIMCYLGSSLSNWYSDFPIKTANNITHINLNYLSLLLILLFTIINVVKLNIYYKINRKYIFYASFLQVYLYWIFKIGSMTNHYFIMVLFLYFYSINDFRFIKFYFIITFIFFIQDFIFYGFGRDFSFMRYFLGKYNLGFITIVLSFINMVYFTKLFFYNFSSSYAYNKSS